MEIKREYLQKYMDFGAIDQLADEYAGKGYAISRDEKIGKYPADLIARKDNETIIIEVKSRASSPQKRAAIGEISDFVKSRNNHKFLVVFAGTPKKKKLEVSHIDELLTNYLEQNVPEELLPLAAKMSIKKVSDIVIDELNVTDSGAIGVKGNGIAKVELLYGSDTKKDDNSKYITDDNFYFDFELILKPDTEKKLQISEVISIKVDTGSYDL